MRPFIFLLLSTVLTFQGLSAQRSKADVEKLLRNSSSYAALLDSLSARDYRPEPADIPRFRAMLWQLWVEDQNRFSGRREAFESGECSYGEGKTGFFTAKVKGERPASGYPVFIGLHGGGGGPKEMNDQQWEQMQRYYLSSIDTGIYVAPRGPNNTWNLHFDQDAQAFYDQLLTDLRVFAEVDPNRIYLLGYSAGGDGVYQLAPRMASQLAAANMSAGHHNGVAADNLQHLPMMLQVGELDNAYHRNLETVHYSKLLDELSQQFPGDFIHQMYVHAGAEHSYVKDRQGPDYQAKVLAQPEEWLYDFSKDSSTIAISDAPTWLKQFRRNPHPAYLRWDLSTVLEGHSDWYWISVKPSATKPEIKVPKLEVRFSPKGNQFDISGFPGYLEIHLHEALVDMGRPANVVVEGKNHAIALEPSLQAMASSLAQHSDPNYSSWQTVRIWRGDDGAVRVE